jgi:hypothetical protein
MKFSAACLPLFLASVIASPVETRTDVSLVKRSHPKRGAAYNAAGAVNPLASTYVLCSSGVEYIYNMYTLVCHGRTIGEK